MDLNIINDTLFLTSMTQYFLYSNQDITYENLGGIISFDRENQAFYSLVLDNTSQNVMINKQTSSGELSSLQLPINPGYVPMSLFNRSYFNFPEVFNNTQIRELDEGLIITSVYKENEWFNFLQYDASRIEIKPITDDSSIISYMSITTDRTIQILDLSQINGLKQGLDPYMYTYIEIVIFTLVFLSMFIPFSNYRSTITIIDFNTPFKIGRKRIDGQ
jgi:hypothetical protein